MNCVHPLLTYGQPDRSNLEAVNRILIQIIFTTYVWVFRVHHDETLCKLWRSWSALWHTLNELTVVFTHPEPQMNLTYANYMFTTFLCKFARNIFCECNSEDNITITVFTFAVDNNATLILSRYNAEATLYASFERKNVTKQITAPVAISQRTSGCLSQTPVLLLAQVRDTAFNMDC